MNRIDALFKEKQKGILSVYMTAGYPELEDTVPLLQALQSHGADMVEIGIPFSDPLADGPVIQASSQVSLKNGMKLALLFDQLKDIRQSIRIPLVLMGYLNPVLQMGMEHFLLRCQQCGIDGVIIPDLPPTEYKQQYRDQFLRRGIHHTLLITPHTSRERILQIAALSGGFLYLVADAATTGGRKAIGDHQLAYFQRIREMKLPVPGLIGFGISSPKTFDTACANASGAIIGSAFIRAIGATTKLSLEEKVKKFLGEIRN